MGPAANWSSTQPVQYSASAIEPKSAAPTIYSAANTNACGSSKLDIALYALRIP
jgi:hypothetical protein